MHFGTYSKLSSSDDEQQSSFNDGVDSSGASSSSNNVTNASTSSNIFESSIKVNYGMRYDPDEPDQSSTENAAKRLDTLECRLRGILCCVVCFELPTTRTYQCKNGHLMCSACIRHLLADARLCDHYATCPTCRVEISSRTASRNFAVEQAGSELPHKCQYCGNEYPYKALERHETVECQERPINCKYSRIGCQWNGPNHKTKEHESNCLHATKSGHEIMTALEAYDSKILKVMHIPRRLIDLLSCQKISFNDLQLKAYQSDEYMFYESARFQAFNYYWKINALINDTERETNESQDERTINYRLVLRTTMITAPIKISFLALKGPFSDMQVFTQIFDHEFTEQSRESKYFMLPLTDRWECNRLLANIFINMRLIMFLIDQ